MTGPTLSSYLGVKRLLALIGEVQANPTANTLLDRLKTIAALLAPGGNGGIKVEVVAVPVTVAVNAGTFPLPGNQLFPARGNGRRRIELYNPPTNHAVTVTFASTYYVVLQPGATYARAAEANYRSSFDGAISATGTAGETVQAEDIYIA